MVVLVKLFIHSHRGLDIEINYQLLLNNKYMYK